MNNKDSFERWLERESRKTAEDISEMAWAFLHFVWLAPASVAFKLGQWLDRGIQASPEPTAYIGWTLGTAVFLFLSWIYGKRLGVF